MVTVTKKAEPTPPWKSQKIWAMVIGVGLVAILFAFGRNVEAVALAGLVGTFILGRGLERLGSGIVLVVALEASACGVTQAQVAVQTSLTGLAEGVHAGDGALVAAMPTIRDRAIACARERCGGYATCADASVYLADCFARADAAVDGLEVAAEGLRLAQVAQDAWVASGDLPDADPLCAALGDAVTPLVSLLDEAGVEVPRGIAGAGGVVEVICGVVARWATPETVEVARDE